jgi:hypothetical protein
MKPGQRIHESVFDKIDQDHSYRPRAYLYDSLDWNSDEDLRNVPIEKDPYTTFARLLKELTDSTFNVSDQQLDERIASVESGEYSLCCANLFSLNLNLYYCYVETVRRSIHETDGAAKTLLRILRDAIAREDVDQARKNKSVNLLLGALAASRPTEDSKKTFSEFGLAVPVVEAARKDPRMHHAVLEVLKKFVPSECEVILSSYIWQLITRC